jgi:hypothetical protein
LIAAANMFDILPESATPSNTELTATLIEAKKSTKEIFKALPDSDERTSILNALGRLGKNSLKQKIAHRTNILIAVAGDKYPEIITVAYAAVEYRNFFVHGTKPKKLDPIVSEHLLVPFLTETLEFIFAASDLLDAGWDIKSWLGHGSSGGHPFREYSSNYEWNLKKFKTCFL